MEFKRLSDCVISPPIILSGVESKSDDGFQKLSFALGIKSKSVSPSFGFSIRHFFIKAPAKFSI